MALGCFFVVQGQFLWFQVGFHDSRSVFEVPGWFFMVPGEFSWFQVDHYGHQLFQVCFHNSRWVLWIFRVPGFFFMIIHGSRSVFLDSRLVFMVFHGSWLVYIRAERRRHEVRR